MEEFKDLLDEVYEKTKKIISNCRVKTNDYSGRLEIRVAVESYLEGVKLDKTNKVVDFEAIMDESNNPPEIVDQNMAIIDIIIENEAKCDDKFECRFKVNKFGIEIIDKK